MSFRISTMVIFLFGSIVLRAQVGGNNPFAFTHTAPSAGISSLGGNGISLNGSDPALAFQNPALIQRSMSQKGSFSYMNYLSDIQFSHFATAISAKKITLALNVHLLNSGKFDLTDVTGISMGTFSGKESAIQLSSQKQLSAHWSGGIGIRYLQASYGFYHYSGIAGQLGFHYFDSSSQTSAAIVLDQIGTMLTQIPGSDSRLPYQLQAAFSKKLDHLPLRFQIVAHHLTQWNIRYYDPNDVYYNIVTQTIGSTTPTTTKNYTFDKIFRHINLGAELNLGKNLMVRLGYNDLRRSELSIPTKSGMNGFSYGFTLKTKKFDFTYGRIPYALAGGAHQFSFLFSPSLWLGK
jgi:hypothetical protein